MPYNLLEEKWLPVRRADGSADTIAPWQIADTTNPVIALDAPRPDFNGALIQFLIGLVQTTFAPEDEDTWFEVFESPPTPDTLKAAFAKYQEAFNLDGEGARFMQDLDELEAQKPLPITVLLMDTMGSETHFVKDLPQDGVHLGLAAMTLYTLQTNAPSGGAGHRTSMRGGGPLTTLVLATPKQNNAPPLSLWHTIWLNVLEKEVFASPHQRPQDIFPWLAPTRVSDKTSQTPVTVQESVNPLQMFWGMPRRIRLNIEPGETPLVREYRTKNYGINYPGETWQHVLSPHSSDGKQTLPIHARGAVNYRHWLGLVKPLSDKKNQRIPATVISAFTDRYLHQEGLRFRAWAFGYDMDNMKPVCWYEATMPLFHFTDEADRQFFEGYAENLILAASEFMGNLRGGLKDAWFSSGDPRRKGADTGFIESAFWADTERSFYDLLEQSSKAPQDIALRNRLYALWHRRLNTYTLDTFDRWANSQHIADQTHPKRVAIARRDLARYNWKKSIKDKLELPDKPAAKQAA